MRVEGIITSLVFDHALRIRLKAEMGEKKDEAKVDDTTSVSTGPGSDTKGSNSPDIGSGDEDDNATVHSRSTTAGTTASTSTAATAVAPPPPPGAAKAADAKKQEEKADAESPKSKGANLIGKINNLVTSDLEHITEGRDFLFIGALTSQYQSLPYL